MPLASLVMLIAGWAQGAPAFTVPEPYFQGPAAQDFALEKWESARVGFAALLPRAPPEDHPRLELLVGLCDARLGRWLQAARELERVSLPLVADYVHHEAARAFYFAGQLDAARKEAERVAPDSVLADEARLLVGDVLRGQRRWREAAALYERYLDKGRVRLPEARFHLAEAHEQLHQPAQALYQQVAVEAPLEVWGERAQTALRKRGTRALTAPELTSRGKVYFENMRNELSEADFATALLAPGLTPDLACVAQFHRAESVFKQRQRARAAPLFDLASAACAETRNEDLQVRSAYQGGRAWSAAGDLAKAAAHFAAAEEGHAGHSFADDARLRQSEAWASRETTAEPGAAEQVTALLLSIPERYPNGDMKGEALWRLAWRAYRAGDYPGAIAWLQKSIETVGHETRYYAEGQSLYWIARARARVGDRAGAHASYVRTVREYPLSYYALLALNRLREEDPREMTRLMDELRRPPPAWHPGTPVFTTAPRPLWGTLGYRRAVELLRLGMGAAAERELARAGLRVPEGRKEATDPDQIDQLWATALLYDRARLYDKSHWIARWSVLDYKNAWPSEANRAKWDIAYPRAWWHVIEPAARAQGYPPEILISFVREESAFNPILESFANAVGLTQMILPTAKRFGSGLGFEITRENLRDPTRNVAVGSRWLGFLWQTFDRNVGLIVPAYNAGENAVGKWLCARGDWPLDEFGEQIPYDETRNYTKRVLSSYFAFSYLRNGTVPVVANAIAPAVINLKKCPPPGAALREGADKPDKKAP